VITFGFFALSMLGCDAVRESKEGDIGSHRTDERHEYCGAENGAMFAKEYYLLIGSAATALSIYHQCKERDRLGKNGNGDIMLDLERMMTFDLVGLFSKSGIWKKNSAEALNHGDDLAMVNAGLIVNYGMGEDRIREVIRGFSVDIWEMTSYKHPTSILHAIAREDRDNHQYKLHLEKAYKSNAAAHADDLIEMRAFWDFLNDAVRYISPDAVRHRIIERAKSRGAIIGSRVKAGVK
jgi:hypothetical protein